MGLRNLLFRRGRNAGAARCLYETVVTQARHPVFYRDLGVPDSLDGRFEMIALHAFLVMHRLKQEIGSDSARPKATKAEVVSQDLFDLMFADMDQSLREMGAGDLGVGKRVKKMAEAFYGRLSAYDAALAQGEERAVGEALRRNLLGTLGEVEEDRLAGLARYFQAQAAFLQQQLAEDIIEGRLTFEKLDQTRG